MLLNMELPYANEPGRCNLCGDDISKPFRYKVNGDARSFPVNPGEPGIKYRNFCPDCHGIATNGIVGDDWIHGLDMNINRMDEVEEIGGINWFGE